MKTLLVAIVVALIASTSTAVATSYINGKRIKPGSIPANRLTAGARASLRGTPGPQGPQGNQGNQGATGPQGPQGQKGDTGTPGPQGAAGAAGTSVTTNFLSAPEGPCNSTPDGQFYYGSKFSDGTNTTYACTGPQGPQGATGPQGPSGVATTTVRTCTHSTLFGSTGESAYCVELDGPTVTVKTRCPEPSQLLGASAVNTTTGAPLGIFLLGNSGPGNPPNIQVTAYNVGTNRDWAVQLVCTT